MTISAGSGGGGSGAGGGGGGAGAGCGVGAATGVWTVRSTGSGFAAAGAGGSIVPGADAAAPVLPATTRGNFLGVILNKCRFLANEERYGYGDGYGASG